MNKRNFGNISLQNELDFSIRSENKDIWSGSFPYKQGDKFPSDKLKARADVSKTNHLLFNNEYDKIFGFMLNNIPELDPIYGMQIKEIVSNLPYFKVITDAYVSLCCSTIPTIDTPDKVDVTVSNLISNSNMNQVVQSLFRSLMVDPVDAYKLSVDINGNPVLIQIPVRNFEVFISPEDLVTPYCVNVSNVLEDKVEFISYYYDGRIEKRTFKYSNGLLGEMIGDIEEDLAFGGRYKESPVVVIRHNTESINDVYGVDQFRYWDAGILGLCRSLNNLFRLNERCREVIRKVPEGAVSRLNNGASIYINKGVITYPDGTSSEHRPDIQYLVPELKNNIEACIESINKTTKLLSTSSALSPIWFDFENLGSNLSAKSIKAAMTPTILKIKMMRGDMEEYLKEIVRKVALLGDVVLNKTDIGIVWSPVIEDTEEELSIIDRRLNNNTLSLEDAIARIDGVSRRTARERANKILNRKQDNTGIDNTRINLESNDELSFDTSDEGSRCTSGSMNDVDNISSNNEIIPDVALPFTPRNR